MIIIDGSIGEGGGQVLRSSLGLSLVTGQPFKIINIRSGRSKPGLMRQHLTAVHAAAAISNANVKGDTIGSLSLEFEPGHVKPGNYEFAVGTAGSATLVLQTVLPALMTADCNSHLSLKGGTHNPWSPPFDFLKKTFLPILGRMGFNVSVDLKRPGFYPAGGGEFTVNIVPTQKYSSLKLLERGEIISRKARAILAKLSNHIGHRELDTLERKLGWSRELLSIERMDDSAGPGNVVILEIESENINEVITAFGELSVQAETVAERAVAEFRNYITCGAPAGEHLADQLLIPIAIAGGCFRTLTPSKHTTTNIEVIKKFLDVEIDLRQISDQPRVWQIEVKK